MTEQLPIVLGLSTASATSGGGINYVIETAAGVLYVVFLESVTRVVFRKSSDGGLTWSAPTAVFSGSTPTQLSVWYDRWSGIAAGLIHCAYTEGTTDDTHYRSIDTENSDTLSSETTIFAGASTALPGSLSICRARGGNLYCATQIDAGAEAAFARSTDVGATWGARTTVWEVATQDQIILMPGWAADNQDMMAFFWDASADEISRKLYDDSGDSWSETSIATSMADVPPNTAAFPHFAAAVDIANSRNLLVAWSAVDTANADLRCWYVTESAITEVTNVVANSTDDQGLCSIGIDTDTGDWHVFYCGASDGSETWPSAINVYKKISTDDGTTWGSETKLTADTAYKLFLFSCPRFTGAHVGIYQPGASQNATVALVDIPAAGGLATPMFGGGIVA